jgi:hypothetical protein
MDRHAVTLTILALTAAAVLGWMRCTTRAPTKPSEPVPPIRLSVGKLGTTRATFTGTPLPLIVQLGDSLAYRPDAVSFDKGEATFLLPAVGEGTKVRELTYRFFWTVMARNGPDSVTGLYFDTLSARIGLEQSNVVRIYVKNLAPQLCSLVVGDTSVAVAENVYGDHFYTFHVDSVVHPDSIRLPLRLVARDNDALDAHKLVATWQPRIHEDLIFVENGPPTRGLAATYYLPETNFSDTIQVTLQDRHTHIVAHAVLYRTGGKTETHVDSVIVGDSVFTNGSKTMVYHAPILASTRMRVFTTAQKLTAQWTAGRDTVKVLPDLGASFAAMYVCTSAQCTETLTEDTAIVADTVELTLTSNSGEHDTYSIIFVRVPANHHPVIDSVLVDTVKMLTGTRKLARHEAAVGDTLMLSAYASDAENEVEELTLEWSSFMADRIVERPGHNSAVYVCADTACIDTLTITVEDTLQFTATKRVILTVTPRPIIDSIAVGDSLYRDVHEAIVFQASLGDTLDIVSHAHSPWDEEIETTFECASEALSGKIGLDGLRYYALNDTPYVDTCAIVVKDSKGVESEKEVIIELVNYRPVIDSVVITGIRNVAGTFPISFSSSAVLSATALDTLTIQLYASDEDDETVTDTWRLSDSSNAERLERKGDMLVQYRCLDRLYNEKLFVDVTDSFGATASATIAVSINNRNPHLDSIAAGDSVHTWTIDETAPPTHRSMVDSLVTLTDYGADPDDGDELSVQYHFLATDRTGTVASGVEYVYIPLPDSTYLDTAVITLEDQRGASVSRHLILEFVRP